MNIIIKPSLNSLKKFDAIVDNKKISFGAKGMSDYTINKSDERKKLYINRHKKKEDWNNPLTAGFYSKNILWNKKTIAESVKDTNKKYNLNIKIKNI